MAGLYIFLSLFTAVIFILTRECLVTVIKNDCLVIRVDFVFFAVTLYKREKSVAKKSQKKTKSRDLPKKIYGRITKLLSYSRIDVKRLCINIFPEPNDPFEIPFISANSALNYLALSYLASISGVLTLSETDESDESLYHLILRTPLIGLLYTVIAIRADVYFEKKKSERLTYVGNKNG